MSDVLRSQPDNEEELVTLFATWSENEPLPPALLDRLTASVLNEVRNELTSDLQADQSSPSSKTLPQAYVPAMERVRSWLRLLSPRQSLLLAGAGAVAVMLLFVGISRVTPRLPAATADVSGGDATVLSQNSNRFHVQQDGDLVKVRQGDRILTGDGSVHLAHFPEHVTVIQPGADVEVARLDDTNGGRQLALTVNDGVVYSSLGEPLGSNDRYVIHTPGVTVTAAGTEFAVETVSEKETLVTTFSGSVTVTMEGYTVTVGPGEEVDAVTGQPLKVQAADGKYDGGTSPLLLAVDDEIGAQLYAEPDADSAHIGQMTAGQTVSVEAQDPSGQWLQVCCVADQSGWVQVK